MWCLSHLPICIVQLTLIWSGVFQSACKEVCSNCDGDVIYHSEDLNNIILHCNILLLSSRGYIPGMNQIYQLHEHGLQCIMCYIRVQLDKVLGESRPPWPRQIITPVLPSVSINYVCSSLTICINECRAVMV